MTMMANDTVTPIIICSSWLSEAVNKEMRQNKSKQNQQKVKHK